jgi:hypothetical protein
MISHHGQSRTADGIPRRPYRRSTRAAPPLGNPLVGTRANGHPSSPHRTPSSIAASALEEMEQAHRSSGCESSPLRDSGLEFSRAGDRSLPNRTDTPHTRCIRILRMDSYQRVLSTPHISRPVRASGVGMARARRAGRGPARQPRLCLGTPQA